MCFHNIHEDRCHRYFMHYFIGVDFAQFVERYPSRCRVYGTVREGIS
jgi:hypothetical protein